MYLFKLVCPKYCYLTLNNRKLIGEIFAFCLHFILKISFVFYTKSVSHKNGNLISTYQ
jgi:hypothetical protein